MRKIFSILAISILLSAGAAYSAEYYIDGWVFAADGASGTAATENSFATMHAYRTGINGQLGVLNPPGRVFPLAGSGQAAFNVSDVGSSNWASTAAAEGQTITAVFEVYDTLFGWSGGSYIACTRAVITGPDAINLQTDINSVQLKAIPTPQIDSLAANQAVLSLTGMDENYIDSYNLYRSTSLYGAYVFIAVVPQNRGNTIQYIDNSVLSGQDYYYKWGVNFVWGGGGGAPVYYTSAAMSQASNPADAPTVTETETALNTATQTVTPVIAGTATMTAIPTPPVEYEPVAYPQPAKDTITFAYKLSVPSAVKIFVYNLMGTEVAVFDQPAGDPGISTAVCQTGKFPPGIYFYIIKAVDSGVKFKASKFMIER